MDAATVRLLSVLLIVVHGVVWAVVSRWERPGRSAPLRAGSPVPRLVVAGGNVAMVIPPLYPVVVVAAPAWGYEGPLNWSSRIDVPLQVAGLGLWATGLAVLVWAARILGHYMDVEGVTEEHELVDSGPYRHVRHPVYSAFTGIAIGLCLMLRSYLLAAVAVAWLAAALWWASSEEELLSSPEGLGDTYRTYTERTGRFLPRGRQG